MAETKQDKQDTYTLHEMREKSGVTGASAAKACGTTYTSLRNWEKGETIPNIIHVNILLNLYGHKIGELDLTPFEKNHQNRIDKQRAAELQMLHMSRAVRDE